MPPAEDGRRVGQCVAPGRHRIRIRACVFGCVRGAPGLRPANPGIPGPRGLRVGALTHLIEGVADVRSVQELSGHATLATTQFCTHVSVERLKATYAQAHPRA
ncbi:MAG TPA: tyrosine-type recombinase/integrase [Yinghuangia sp.]|uniref:tyrosine-type recombinase/integrase n=1 Tax=Yinghuangia sp. YIM S10712 TaxID=3436930 RepID=UPI002C76D5AC|nr:tyrosine-type recombinase/integrase [Yinghuangia sp.]